MLVDFYHLTVSPLERVLPRICEKLLAEGERLLIVAETPLLAQIDSQLWTYGSNAFLPHGLAGRDHAETQPVLLSEEPAPRNGAANVAIADGRWREEALSFARTFYFFDSSLLEEARSLWRTLLKEEEVEQRYWKQDDRGKWLQGP
jgi:DNA polymerase III subunit chi